jgi:zinc/manganese transport system permease protein
VRGDHGARVATRGADVLSQPFMQHAFLAGTLIAAACGAVGYFVVLRGQVFGGDALSHVAFTGALAALAFGADARVGLFVATVAVGAAMGMLGPRGRPDDVVIGNVFTWILGLGVLFMTLYAESARSAGGTTSISVLFGSVFGLSTSDAVVAAVIGFGACVAVVVLARPLLFASADVTVAEARGVPVRALGIAFLALVGVCAAEATQAVGALLLVGLLAAPAGAARRLTTNPWRGLALSGVLAVLVVWAGLVASYLDGDLPPSFSIMAAAAACYLLAVGIDLARARSSS